MNKEEVNITAILNSRMALHDFGIPVKKLLNSRLNDINNRTLFIINLKGVNPMDYEFVNISFHEIIDKYINDKNVYIAFKVDKWELEELCTGILDILNLKSAGAKSEMDTLKVNQFDFIYIDQNNETKYVSSYSESHLDVLKDIEGRECTSSTEIQSKFGLIPEQTTKILEDLKKSKFIYEIEGPKYCSITALIGS